MGLYFDFVNFAILDTYLGPENGEIEGLKIHIFPVNRGKVGE